MPNTRWGWYIYLHGHGWHNFHCKWREILAKHWLFGYIDAIITNLHAYLNEIIFEGCPDFLSEHHVANLKTNFSTILFLTVWGEGPQVGRRYTIWKKTYYVYIMYVCVKHEYMYIYNFCIYIYSCININRTSIYIYKLSFVLGPGLSAKQGWAGYATSSFPLPIKLKGRYFLGVQTCKELAN